MRIEKKINELIPTACSFQLLLILFIPVFFSSCSQHDQQRSNRETRETTAVNVRSTNLADLPDSNKPVTIAIAQRPAPSVTAQLSPPSKHSFLNPLTGLPVAADAQGRGFFTTYSTDNGLALDQIYCGYKDSIGNLWFGTSGGGVSKYDGKDFTNYTTAQGLANNIIWSIVEDNAGSLWFGTDGSGVSKYDGKVFTNYSTAQGLANDVVLSIKKDRKGNLWFGTLGGVSKYDGHTFTNYTTARGLANNAVRSIIEDRNGNLWFGTFAGVSKYDGKTFTNYSKAQGLINDTIRSMLEDKAGNLWLGTSAGVSEFDGNSFTNYSSEQGLTDYVVYCVTEDRSGNLWFGTNGGGVSKYDGRLFTNYTVTQGLANNIVRSITEDESGDLWFGTFGGGVSKYAGKSFTNFTKAEGLSNNVIYSITEDRSGGLWFGTFGGGVEKYDGQSITNYTIAQGVNSNIIYCMAKDRNDNLWFGSFGRGVCKYDGKKFTTYTTAQGLANDVVFSILQDKTGNMWFGTSGGVSRYDGKTFTNYGTRQGLGSDEVFSIFEDGKGDIWFGTSGGGVTEYDGTGFTNYTTAEGLANNVVWTITEDNDSNLWIGTQEGLSLLRQEKLAQLAESIRTKKLFSGNLFESFTIKEGLPDNFITQVVKSNDNRLYIGTNLGVCELLPSSAAGGKQKNWTVGKTFNSSTGYPVKDVNAGLGGMFMDSKGIIWIGTGSDKTGLVRFDPSSVFNNTEKFPAIVLESVKVNNENICWNDLAAKDTTNKYDSNTTAPNITEEVNIFGRRLNEAERDSMRKKFDGVSFDSIAKWYPVPGKLILPYHFNNISFDFNAISTSRNFQVKYRYMLNGYNKDWSTPDNKTTAVFGNIYEGNYTFKVEVQNAEGAWSEPLMYSFKVLPPWWRTWWMFAVYAILIIAMVRLFFWLNTRRIIYQNKILEDKIAMATKQIMHEKDIVEDQNKKIETTLTELKSAQLQLIQSEKMASLGELTAGVAHEIQNPLNFVNNFSEVNGELINELMNEAENKNFDEVKAIANDIKENEEKINYHGKRADAIVKGMLQHSRANAGQKEPTDINKLANEFLGLSYHGLRAKDKSFHAEFKTDFDEKIGKIDIVPQDIGRVLLNLFNNAFYAVNEKSKNSPLAPRLVGAGSEGETGKLQNEYIPLVTVRTKLIPPSEGKGEAVEIRVADNGNGIPQNIVDKIFQPFFTTKPSGKGTGLGLSLTYDVIKAHGGEIKVESKEGEGTEFTVVLPV